MISSSSPSSLAQMITRHRVSHVGETVRRTDMTHPLKFQYRHPFSKRHLSSWWMPSVAIYVPDLMPCP